MRAGHGGVFDDRDGRVVLAERHIGQGPGRQQRGHGGVGLVLVRHLPPDVPKPPRA